MRLTSVSELTPTEGARFLLELDAQLDGGAVYRVAIYTPDATYAGRATLAVGGGVELVLEAPAELREHMDMLAKLTARAADKKRSDGMPPWPNRVLRWRGPGRGSE